jgi:hypothetical protein
VANEGWEVRILSEQDYETVIAQPVSLVGYGFSKEKNSEGGGQVVFDFDDPTLSMALPTGQTRSLREQQFLAQFRQDGTTRFEMLAEDVPEDVVPEGGGTRQTKFVGRGTGMVLEWAKVLPDAMPTPTTMDRIFDGMHPMAVWVGLFAEAQARGVCDFVTLSFDADEDSNGDPWGDPIPLQESAGIDMLDLLNKYCTALRLTWEMLPGFVLDVRADAGEHLEDEVVFPVFAGQQQHDRTRSRRALRTDAYVFSGTDVSLVYDATARSLWRKREEWVGGGDGLDSTQRTDVGTKYLTDRKDEQLSRSVRVAPDQPKRTVFVDYDVSDWIKIELDEPDPGDGVEQVVVITIDVDRDGTVTLELTLRAKFDSLLQRLNRRLDNVETGVGITPIGDTGYGGGGYGGGGYGGGSGGGGSYTAGANIDIDSSTIHFEVVFTEPGSPRIGQLWFDDTA